MKNTYGEYKSIHLSVTQEGNNCPGNQVSAKIEFSVFLKKLFFLASRHCYVRHLTINTQGVYIDQIGFRWHNLS